MLPNIKLRPADALNMLTTHKKESHASCLKLRPPELGYKVSDFLSQVTWWCWVQVKSQNSNFEEFLESFNFDNQSSRQVKFQKHDWSTLLLSLKFQKVVLSKFPEVFNFQKNVYAVWQCFRRNIYNAMCLSIWWDIHRSVAAWFPCIVV